MSSDFGDREQSITSFRVPTRHGSQNLHQASGPPLKLHRRLNKQGSMGDSISSPKKHSKIGEGDKEWAGLQKGHFIDVSQLGCQKKLQL